MPEPMDANSARPSQTAPPPPPRRRRGTILFIVKIAVAAGVLCAFSYFFKVDPGELWQKIRRAFEDHAGWMLGGVALLFTSPVLTGLRWSMLVRSQDVPMGAGRAIAMTWIGLLFTLLPGGLVAGDAVKAFLVARDAKRRAAAATSVYMDRALGLMAVLAIGAAAGLAAWDRIDAMPEPERAGARLLVMAAAGGFLAGAAGLAVAFSNAFMSNRLVGRLTAPGANRAFRMLHDVLASVHSYRNHPWMLVKVFALSIVAQGMILAAAACMGQALGIQFTSIEASAAGQGQVYLFGLSLGEIANAAPFLPGGLGALEGALEAIFRTFGAAEGDGMALGLMWHAGGWFVFLWGLVFYLWPKKKGEGTVVGS
jgi:glycosyltransferase 2 family protein